MLVTLPARCSASSNALAAETAAPVEFGPPALAKPSAELLGEQLLAAGRKNEAAEAYRSALTAAAGRRLATIELPAAERYALHAS